MIRSHLILAIFVTALLCLTHVTYAQETQTIQYTQELGLPGPKDQYPDSESLKKIEKLKDVDGLAQLGEYGMEYRKIRKNLELKEKLGKELDNKTLVRPEELRTLFFTLWQYELLKDAKKGYVTTGNTSSAEDYGTNLGLREISLSGIAYKNSDMWTVWLNGERVTPTAIPLEVLDIRVSNEYIDLKWYDAFNNLVYPVRLRPHQRFNLDSRIFLPGITSGP